ncbi:MAG TPA: YggT family protein [Acidimicrobiales bacterium]|nr:YggT family protein [Acidimicrobiales bacterium]HXB38638.1 YggT family protein [Acidimicrobiales bacterium]
MNIFRILAWLIEAYIWLIMFPYAILSWFRIQPGTTLARVQLFLYRATEPVLRPVRRIIRPMGGLDWSFLVVILVAQIVLIPVLRA